MRSVGLGTRCFVALIGRVVIRIHQHWRGKKNHNNYWHEKNPHGASKAARSMHFSRNQNLIDHVAGLPTAQVLDGLGVGYSELDEIVLLLGRRRGLVHPWRWDGYFDLPFAAKRFLDRDIQIAEGAF